MVRNVKRRKKQSDSSLDISSKKETTFVVEKNISDEMSEESIQVILTKINESKTQTVGELKVALGKAEADMKHEPETINSSLMDLKTDKEQLRKLVENYEARQKGVRGGGCSFEKRSSNSRRAHQSAGAILSPQ